MTNLLFVNKSHAYLYTPGVMGGSPRPSIPVARRQSDRVLEGRTSPTRNNGRQVTQRNATIDAAKECRFAIKQYMSISNNNKIRRFRDTFLYLNDGLLWFWGMGSLVL